MTETVKEIKPTTCKACNSPAELHMGQKNGFDLWACVTCGSVTVSPWPTAEDLHAFYQEYKGTHNTYKDKRTSKIKRITKRLQRMLKLFNFSPKDKKFLDVGCNIGYAVKAAQDMGFDAFGIDIDEEAIEIAKKNFGDDRFVTQSVEDCAASGRKAHVIHTSEVIEHVPDPASFVRSLAEILVPGGVLYLTTPDGNHFMLPQKFYRWKACCPPEHILYFSQKGLKIMLEKHGFKVKKFYFSFKPGIKVVAVREKTIKNQ